MADFRKWFLAIAVVLLVAACASAQTVAVTCGEMTAQTPKIRAGGLTERVGEIDFTCVNTSAVPVTAQVTALFNTNVTNRIDSNDMTMAALILSDEKHVEGTNFPAVYRGRVGEHTYKTAEYPAAINSLDFANVVFPAGTTRIVRIANVRVAALAAAANSVYGTPITAGVEIVTTNPTGYTVSYNKAQAEGIVVGNVWEPMKFTVTDCAGNAGTANIQLQQCIDTWLGQKTFGVTFTELYSQAFFNKTEDNGQSFTDGTTTAADISPTWVSNGDRLMAKFALPAALVGKVSIYVSQYQTASKTGAQAVLMSLKANGAGDDSYSPIGWPIDCEKSKGGADNNRWVKLDDATLTASWEVTRDDQTVKDDLTFAVSVSYEAASLASGENYGTGNVSGTMAPISNVSTFSRVDPVMRFLDRSGEQGSGIGIEMDHCVTNLLFPFVGNQAGYHTGMAIINTSLDNVNTVANPYPFDTVKQAGTCTMYFFGQDGDGAAVIKQFVTPSIPAGTLWAHNVEDCHAAADPQIQDFAGYVIARCNFQFGHGYAYLISPSGTNTTSYLALVIPDRDRLNPETGTKNPTRLALPFDYVGGFFSDPRGEMLGF